MSFQGPLSRLLFTALWADKLNHAGFQVRKVHGLSRATVWDGAEERLVRFYFTRQRVPVVGIGELDGRPESEATPDALSPEAQCPVDYLVTDSRSPFPMAVGETRCLESAEKSAEHQKAYSCGLTQSPFPRPYLAD